MKGVSNGDSQGIKLHLGCGETYLPGYINIDFPPGKHTLQKQPKADLYEDIRQLSYPSESVEEIRLHHLFEHFDRPTALRLLIDWYDWLKKGGRLAIETPDFEKCVEVFTRSGRIEDQLKALRHIFGSHEADWACHYDGWYRAKFELYLGLLGYKDLAFRYTEWQGMYNIIVEAQKSCPFKTRGERRQVAEQLLRFSLVDHSESERRLLKVWMDQLDKVSKWEDSD